MTNYEKETIILFNEGEDKGTIYTCKQGLMNKLDRYCLDQPDNYKLIKTDTLNGKIMSKTYEFDKTLVSLRPKKKKLNLTIEQKKEIANRFKKNIKIG